MVTPNISLRIWSCIELLIPGSFLPKIKHIYLFLRSLLYLGNNFICPCCGGHFKKFLPFGNRPNFICPRDGSYKRQRLIWLYLKNKTNFFSNNLRVLHFGPEYCFQMNFKKMSNLDYISADLNSPEAMVKMDVTNILFKDDYFDVIICIHLLEHVLDDRKALKELYRVLKPGGWAIIQSPINSKLKKTFEDNRIIRPENRRYYFGQEDHVRIYGQDYKTRLENAGFIVKVDDFVKSLGAEKIQKYGLYEKEKIYFCIKSTIT